MIAKEDKSMEAAVVTLRELSAEDEIRLQCEARERYEWDKASYIDMGRREGIVEGKIEGKIEGKMEELINTERERVRAEEAEAEVARLKELLKTNPGAFISDF